MNLPTAIEIIEYGFFSTDEEVAKLKETFPSAIVFENIKGMYMVDVSSFPWDIAETRVNRRRKTGWRDSQFSMGTLDLSETAIDMTFAELLRPVYSDTYRIIFGHFDSSETATWVTRQCPRLFEVDTNGFELTYSAAMQLPNSVRKLTIHQNSISADEFVELTSHFRLEQLNIVNSEFDDIDRAKIRDARLACKVSIESDP